MGRREPAGRRHLHQRRAVAVADADRRPDRRRGRRPRLGAHPEITGTASPRSPDRGRAPRARYGVRRPRLGGHPRKSTSRMVTCATAGHGGAQVVDSLIAPQSRMLLIKPGSLPSGAVHHAVGSHGGAGVTRPPLRSRGGDDRRAAAAHAVGPGHGAIAGREIPRAHRGDRSAAGRRCTA